MDRGKGEAGSRATGLKRRLVLLGASNLTRGFPTVLATATGRWGGGLDVVAALGHGRSYGIDSRLVIRALRGILHCRLWEDLAARPPLPTSALLTDIGNDLFYGVEVAEIAAWVESCVDRLQAAGAEVLVTALPICNLPAVNPRQFAIMRRIMFPSSDLTFDVAVERAIELDERVKALAAARGLVRTVPQRQWYGLDPIHIRRPHYRRAWSELLALEAAIESAAAPREQLGRWSYFRFVPDERWVFGLRQRRAQPSVVLADGTRISFY